MTGTNRKAADRLADLRWSRSRRIDSKAMRANVAESIWRPYVIEKESVDSPPRKDASAHRPAIGLESRIYINLRPPHS